MTASPALSGVSIDRHSMTELMDVERLTPALSSDWLEQQGVMPLRLVDGRLEEAVLTRLRREGRPSAITPAASPSHRMISAYVRTAIRSATRSSRIISMRFVPAKYSV